METSLRDFSRRPAVRLRELRQENVLLKRTLGLSHQFSNIVGRSQAMLDVFKMIETIARTNSTILLTGESGTGKGLVAQAVHFHSPRAALDSGIVRIAQGLSIVPALSVAQNVLLGAEPRKAGFLRRGELRRRYAELAARAGFELDGEANAGSLRTAEQQKTEILRALARDAELIVMDEPTAALSRPDVATLHGIIRRRARAGTATVPVSHFLGAGPALADHGTRLRGGHRPPAAAPGGPSRRPALSHRRPATPINSPRVVPRRW